jgi:hypothetical protein
MTTTAQSSTTAPIATPPTASPTVIRRGHLTLIPTTGVAPAPVVRPSGWDAPPLLVGVAGLAVTLLGAAATLALSAVVATVTGHPAPVAACVAIVGIASSAVAGMATITRLAPGGAARTGHLGRQGTVDTEPSGAGRQPSTSRSQR